MKIGPKYKIARRLGAPVFEKTQTQKFALHLERKGRSSAKLKSEFGFGLNEKQKARFTYGLSEKQFSNYAKKAVTQKDATKTIFESLEGRVDNVVYRLGLAKTRLGARQMVSHGHILVNGRKATPSLQLKIGDIISVRPGSIGKGLFSSLSETITEVMIPVWLSFDILSMEGRVIDKPEYKPAEQVFDLNAVIEFYNR